MSPRPADDFDVSEIVKLNGLKFLEPPVVLIRCSSERDRFELPAFFPLFEISAEGDKQNSGFTPSRAYISKTGRPNTHLSPTLTIFLNAIAVGY